MTPLQPDRRERARRRTSLLEWLLSTALVAALVAVAAPTVALSATDGQPAATATTTQPGYAAVSNATDPAAAQAERGWVTGRVLRLNGEPVEGALVNVLEPREVPKEGILADESDRRTWTAADGSFKVREGNVGYLVQVCEPISEVRTACKETAQGVPHLITYVGPAGVTDSWVLQTRLFDVAGGVRMLGTIRVKRQGFVQGRVVNAASAQLRVMRLNDTVAFWTPTDAEGDYRFRGLAPGRYYVEGGGQGWLPWRSPVIRVRAGRTVRVDGTLDRGAVIRGRLTSAGKPVRLTDVLVRRLGEGIVAAATTNRRGRFRVSGLVPGGYRVGLLYHGSMYIPRGVGVTVPEADSVVEADVAVRRGAVLRVDVRTVDGTAPAKVVDEFRVKGHAIQGFRNDSGTLTYTGLRRGAYTIVAATKRHYALRTVKVRRLNDRQLRPMRVGQPTITLRGRTAPNAVVEAWTGNDCPPDGPTRPGSFQFIEKANDVGRYRIAGLVPGRYMVGADGWPHNYAPACTSEVKIWADQRRNIPLPEGGTAGGRLVYAETGTPVITSLSYELFYPPGLTTNPTDEHPMRARTRGATGRFLIDRLSTGSVEGELAKTADYENLTSAEFLVTFPFQDGTPYWLSSDRQELDVVAGEHLELGDIPITINR